jgi:hypothetical protein
MSTFSQASSREIVIKQSSFVFLKRVAILELLLTALPMLVEPGPWVENSRTAPLDAVLQVDVRQGWLARRLDYGTLLIQVAQRTQPLVMWSIPDPWRHAQEILDRTAVQPAPVALLEDKSLSQLRQQGEGQFLEFKSSLMWDYRKQAVNKELYEPVMKNLAGFMNTAGAWLLIGVGDDGEVLGIEPDFTGLKKKDVDGFENVFNKATQYIQGRFQA